MRGIRRHLRELLALGAMVLVALPVAGYILDNQRLVFPWEHRIELEAEFETAQSVSPGQGQTVTIAGVKVGEIVRVELEDGLAVVTTQIDPDESGPIYSNATMFLRPKTGLNDMTIQLDPGRPDASKPGRGELGDGDRLRIENTSQHVNPDEVLAHLDTDTRRYLTIVANAGGGGLRGRGPDLRKLLKAAEPTFRHTRRVNSSLAARRAQIRRLVRNLRLLAGATAAQDEELAGLVESSSAVLETIGAREARLEAAVARLPGALGATRRALGAARRLAGELQPAAEELGPLARELGPALVELRPLLADAAPILRDDLRPLVREVQPLLARLRPSVAHLARATPDLVRTGKVLNEVVNQLAYNPPGAEEGFLFWTAWFVHNANSILKVEDAHGVTWRGLVMVGCSSLDTGAPSPLPLAALLICPDDENAGS